MKFRTEFIGMPAAGKSTSAEILLARLQRSSAAVLGRRDSIVLALRRRNDGRLKNTLKSLHPAVWMRFLGCEYALAELRDFCAPRPALLRMLYAGLENYSPRKDDRVMTLESFFLSFVEHQLQSVHLGEEESVVVDEGLAQRVFTLFGLSPRPVEEGDVEEFVREVPAPDFLVWVDTSAAICLERLSGRPRGPRPWFRKMERERQLKLLEAAAERLERIVRAFEEKGVEVVRIEGRPDAAGSGEGLDGLAARMEG